ncbi:aminotransferase DegT [Geothrix limicola]|uniref:Aminotransferase DegT n=1 Tax=Geothrix limicola TaxID=2927978 RepID=A0ABQ5QG75_9BACT|nr:aminotransferase class I/II-fold pyridoxal phosphate-dependent enzyme [Geothrix limicola]GLH73049.1 aminotransferase DegT [Geothrix limicola]
MINLAEPNLSGNEMAYLRQCVDTNFVSSVGPFVTQFEQAFAQFVGSPHAVAISNGTAAIHMALILAGVGPGDEVIVSDFTFAASGNPIFYQGARPILVDSEMDTWNLDPALVVEELDRRARLDRPMPKVVLAVHILGCPARLDAIAEACDRYGIWLIEDAAEALGARYTEGVFAGRQVGTIGRIGCFSFNGNKIMTTGGGGMLVTADAVLAQQAKHLTTQAKLPGYAYFHNEVGYNYRLTNLAAALGVAQLERLGSFLQRKAEIANRYDAAFQGLAGVVCPPRPAGLTPTFWLYSILLQCRWEAPLEQLLEKGIQTRPLWTALHMMPPYKEVTLLGSGRVSESLCAHGLSLPCSTGLSGDDQQSVIEAVLKLHRQSS